MAKGKKVPFSLARGMWSGGDAAAIPPDAARRLRNVVRKNGPWVARPQFTYDGIADVRGLGIWYDEATGARRLVALDGTDTINAKAASGETYTETSGLTVQFVRDAVSYRGRWYATLTTAGGLVTGLRYVVSYSGSGYSALKLNASTATYIGPQSMAVFKERMFYGGLTLTVDDKLRESNVATPYDATQWTKTNVDASSVTSGSTTTYRITPTDTTTAKLVGPSISPSSLPCVFRAEFRGVDADYRVPLTISIKYTDVAWNDVNAYALNAFVVPGNGYIYRCTVAGTSGAVEPTWPTTLRGTVVDGTATWRCEGSDVAASAKVYVPNATDTQQFTTFYVEAVNPLTAVSPIITFGHGSTFTAASLDFGYTDGLDTANPRKENHGQQFTLGSFYFPFANEDNESANYTANQRDYLYWSEIGRPEELASANYYRIREIPGDITAIRAVGGKLVVFKRNAFWVFGATNDPDNPVLPEGDARVGTGTLNPKSIDVFEDYVYFVAEDEIYRMRVGDDPEPLCGEGMRDEIMSKSSTTWPENLSLTAEGQYASRVLLAVDQKNRRVWVYAQKGKLYCYDIDAKAWSVHDVGGSATDNTGYQVIDMIYNPNTGSMYFALYSSSDATIGLARLDETQTGAEDTIAASGTLPVYKDIWLRPAEVESREDLCLHQLDIYHKITASQAGQTLTAYHSFDHGANFSTFETLTVSPVSGGEYDPIQIPYYQSGGTIMPRILHTGKGGAENFNVSRIIATVEVLSGDGAYPTETA